MEAKVDELQSALGFFFPLKYASKPQTPLISPSLVLWRLSLPPFSFMLLMPVGLVWQIRFSSVQGRGLGKAELYGHCPSCQCLHAWREAGKQGQYVLMVSVWREGHPVHATFLLEFSPSLFSLSPFSSSSHPPIHFPFLPTGC